MKVLLADDEKELTKALSAILKFNGYDVDCVYDGKAAYDAALNNEYDAMIFDIMMPVMSGIDALKALREKNVDTPVILLTAKSEFSDRISGLDAGADDYLTKPFNTGELMARLRAMTRRNSENKHEILTCGNVTLNRENLEIKTDSASFRLAGREFKMFEFLISRMALQFRSSSSSTRFLTTIPRRRKKELYSCTYRTCAPSSTRSARMSL